MSNKQQDFLQPDGPETIETKINNVLKSHFSLTPTDLEKIKKSFDEFINEPIDTLWNNVNPKGDNVVVRVFTYNPYDHKKNKNKKIFIGQGTDSDISELRTLNFPVGKILRAGVEAFWVDEEGNKQTYKSGDIVKLKDANTRVIPNPEYEAWVASGANKTNLKKTGQEPPAFINNLMANYWKNMTKANPIDLNVDRKDHYTFDIHMNHLEGKVKNPELYIK